MNVNPCESDRLGRGLVKLLGTKSAVLRAVADAAVTAETDERLTDAEVVAVEDFLCGLMNADPELDQALDLKAYVAIREVADLWRGLKAAAPVEVVPVDVVRAGDNAAVRALAKAAGPGPQGLNDYNDRLNREGGER